MSVSEWWTKSSAIGPDYGYYPKPSKSVVIVKHEADLMRAKAVFEPLGLSVTSDGCRHLGAVVGSSAFREQYVTEKVDMWVKDVTELAIIASHRLPTQCL